MKINGIKYFNLYKNHTLSAKKQEAEQNKEYKNYNYSQEIFKNQFIPFMHSKPSKKHENKKCDNIDNKPYFYDAKIYAYGLKGEFTFKM